jgi:hypothetical protein
MILGCNNLQRVCLPFWKHWGSILANSDTELQGILDIVHHHTQRDLVKINPEKSDLIAYNAKDEKIVKFGDEKIEKSEKTKHLGIVRNGKNNVDIEERLKSGRGTIYGLLGAGIQVRKCFSPIAAHNLWKIYALPRMTYYGLEIMPMTNKDRSNLKYCKRKSSNKFSDYHAVLLILVSTCSLELYRWRWI